MAWTPTERGIKAFENNIPNSFVDFYIEYPAYFEHGGQATFKYFKDAVPSDDEESNLSVFRFLIDGEEQHIDNSTTSVDGSDKFRSVNVGIP